MMDVVNKRLKQSVRLVALTLASWAAAAPVGAEPTHTYTAGHADLAIDYEGGSDFDLHFRFRGATLDGMLVEEERIGSPGDYRIVVSPWHEDFGGESSPFTMPPDLADLFAFTGVAAGGSLHYLSWNTDSSRFN